MKKIFLLIFVLILLSIGLFTGYNFFDTANLAKFSVSNSDLKEKNFDIIKSFVSKSYKFAGSLVVKNKIGKEKIEMNYYFSGKKVKSNSKVSGVLLYKYNYKKNLISGKIDFDMKNISSGYDEVYLKIKEFSSKILIDDYFYKRGMLKLIDNIISDMRNNWVVLDMDFLSFDLGKMSYNITSGNEIIFYQDSGLFLSAKRFSGNNFFYVFVERYLSGGNFTVNGKLFVEKNRLKFDGKLILNSSRYPDLKQMPFDVNFNLVRKFINDKEEILQPKNFMNLSEIILFDTLRYSN